MKYSPTTKSNLNLLKPEVKSVFEILLNECYKREINAQISQSLRTAEEQLKLYNEGKSKAKEAYQSLHFFGLACDIFVNTNRKYDFSRNAEIWEICQELELDKHFGMRWGGNFKSFKDEPHFELSWGKSWREFYAGSQEKPQQAPTIKKSFTVENPTVDTPITIQNNAKNATLTNAINAVKFFFTKK